MKIKLKIFFILMPILIFLSNYSYAMIDSSGKSFSLHNQNNSRNTGYYFVTTDNSNKAVGKIVQTNRFGTVELNNNKEYSIYSLKNGLDISNQKKNVETYNINYDLDEFEKIEKSYRIQLPTDKTRFNKMAWVLNNICIPENELSKEVLLVSAGLDKNCFRSYEISGYKSDAIEKDIIESIQQAAIWHFSNNDGEFHPSNTINLYVSEDLITSTNLNKQKSEKDDINTLYQYLINGAEKAVSNGYEYTRAEKKQPIKFDKSKATVSTVDNNYLIGPYNISTASINCTLAVKVDNGKDEIQNIKIVGSNQKDELKGNNVNEKIISNLGKDFYISIPTTTAATKVNITVETNYNERELKYWTTTANKSAQSEPIIYISNEAKTNIETDSKQIVKTNFDLALRQFITDVNDVKTEKSREPEYKKTDLKMLATNKTDIDNGTTLTKKSKIDGVNATTNDKISLTIRVYNEGQVDSNGVRIIEHLPEGVELISPENSETNKEYKWKYDENNKRIITTDYLMNQTIKGFDVAPENDEYKIDYKDIKLECRITSKIITTDSSLKIIGEILEYADSSYTDRDSKPNNINDLQIKDYNPGTTEEGKGYEDDDDYEEVIVRGKYFDLALRSFVLETEDSNGNKIEYEKEPRVDTAPLVRGEYDANYFGSKSPVSVEVGNIITYTIRIYNEGQMDGYADEIIEHLPEDLEYVNDEFNAEYGWIIDTTDATQRRLKTTVLSKENDADNFIKGFNEETGEIDYKELKLKCKVKTTAPALREITTLTEISKSSNNSNISDRDNKTNARIPSDNELENYKGNELNKSELSDNNFYYRGQEDDDDFDKVVLEKFDLALRSYIVNVNGNDILDREPKVDTSVYGDNIDNRSITTFKYNQNKEELKLSENDVVTFRIRVYNEGTQEGYASIIGHNIPNGLEFIQDNEINQKYKWKYYDENGNQTDDLSKTIYLATDYLAKSSQQSNDANLIPSFNIDNTINYKDVEIVFKITKNSLPEDRKIKADAQIIQETDISGGKINDVDSLANKWQDNDDDQDSEYIYVKYFDISIKMMADQIITIEDGNQKESPTTQNIDDEEKQTVSVSFSEKQLKNTVIKFRFIIKVTNDGEIDGYVSKISDYVPEGMKFNQADNIKWEEENGKIITRQLKNTLIKVGESKTIELILTWDNEKNSMGIKNNYAEINSYNNLSSTQDIDSVPDNKKDGEDDIANISVSISTTDETSYKYIYIGIIAVALIGIGAFIIKKRVL